MPNEIRHNKATGDWVVYAPSRSERPVLTAHDAEHPREPVPEHDEDCPFCPGNEDQLPEILMELSGMDPQTWQTRVVPNKFPALRTTGDDRRYQRGMYVALAAHGRHEVIIESPQHNRKLAEMLTGEVDTIVETYHRRYVDVMAQYDNMLTLIFRNHGPRAGTSIRHPHSQLVASPIVPRYIRWREDEAQRYFDQWGRCVFCDVIAHEIEDGRRVVLENETFLVIVPFAAAVPCEMWLVPKRHQADFGAITDAEKADLSMALRECVVRLSRKLGDPDYNYIINTSARYRADEPQLHWYLQIWPRTVIPAGFEIGSGLRINPSMPEDDAAFLRGDDDAAFLRGE